jgi:acyl dehydratase
MLEKTERLWDYEAVEPGQAGRPTTVVLTTENIAQYARLSQNPDPRFRTGEKPTAMPTMILSYAPLLREDMAENNGFVALEQSQHHRRQTPFAKCEIRWLRPVHAGDTITGNRRVLEKYQRRGSKFVTFRVEAANQRGEKLAEYDYTCIFEYARGQRPAPSEPGPSIDPGSRESGPGEDVGIPASPGPLSFAAVSVGDRLAPLAITESQDIINAKNDFRLAGKPSASNIHTDEEFARQNIFGGTVNAGPATMSYVDQMLEQSFPLSAFYHGGSLLMRAITPFRSGDTVTFGGEVTGKEEEGDKKLVQCRVKGINQRGELVCLADATLNLAG